MTVGYNELLALLKYCPSTGEFHWLTTGKGRNTKQPAGTLNDSGYVIICINRKDYRAHRLAWLYMTGEFPRNFIDHIDGVRNNNRWSNLRSANSTDNQQNRNSQSSNTTGYIGVAYVNRLNKWKAQISHSGVNCYLGLFASPELASAAYRLAKKKLHTFEPSPMEIRT